MTSERVTLYRTNESKTEVIEQYPKTIASQVYDFEKGQFLDKTLSETTQQLAQTEEDVRQRGISITKLGAVGNDVIKDTQAVISAFENYRNIFVPEGTFLIDRKIKWRNGTNLYGINGRSILKFVGEGDFIVGDSLVDASTSFNFSMIDGVKLIGDKSLGVTQNGFNLNGFRSKIRNSRIENFSGIGVNVGGVCLEFEEMYVASNAIGMNIKDLSPTQHSTMFDLKNCNFNYNTLGLTNRNNGQALEENIIHLRLDNTVFEKNTQHFDLRPFDGTMIHCWFEAATNPSITWDYRWFMSGNWFNTGDPSITYQQTEATYNGSVKIQNNGSITAKSHNFSFFSVSGVDVGQLRLTEDWSDVGDTRYLRLNNSNTAKSTLLNETYSKHYRIAYPILINANGTIMRNSWATAGYTATVTKLRTGVYVIDIGSPIDLMPNIEVMSPTSTGDPASYTVPTYYHTLRVINDLGNTDYDSYNLIKKFVIHTFARTVDTNGVITDVPADARINLTIHSSRR